MVTSASELLDMVLIIEDVSLTVTDELFTDILLIVEASTMSLFSILLVLVESNKAVSINFRFKITYCNMHNFSAPYVSTIHSLFRFHALLHVALPNLPWIQWTIMHTQGLVGRW